MFCSKCGAVVTGGQKYCSKCGSALPQEAARFEARVESQGTYTQPGVQVVGTGKKIEGHVKFLGVLWILISVFAILPGIALLFFGSFIFPFMHVGMMPWPVHLLIGPLGAMFGLVFLSAGILGVAAGWGLLSYKTWARLLAIILGVLSLLRFPFGTALGIYTLWVLLPADSEAEYRRLCGAA